LERIQQEGESGPLNDKDSKIILELFEIDDRQKMLEQSSFFNNLPMLFHPSKPTSIDLQKLCNKANVSYDFLQEKAIALYNASPSFEEFSEALAT
jgi:hypothetical protein